MSSFIGKAHCEKFNPDLAKFLISLATHLSSIRHQEALGPVKESVALLRLLAKVRPEEFNSGFANSLHLFADLLGIIGRPKQALTLIEEAIELRNLEARSEKYDS